MSKILSVTVFAAVAIILIGSLWGGVVGNSNDDDEDLLHVFMLCGQSNAQYYQEDITVANELPKLDENTAYYYGSPSAPAEYSDDWQTQYESYQIYSMTNSSGEYTIGSIEPGFAYGFYERTGDKCLIINTARGGASINDFIPGGYLNDYVSTLFEDALNKIPSETKYKLESTIWIQGEADRYMSPAEYVSKYALLQDFFDELGLKTTIMSKVRSQWSPAISNAQKEIASDDKNVSLCDIADTFTISSGTMAADGLHYSQKGRNILGMELSDYAHVPTKANEDYSELIHIIPIFMILAVMLAILGIVFMRRID